MQAGDATLNSQKAQFKIDADGVMGGMHALLCRLHRCKVEFHHVDVLALLSHHSPKASTAGKEPYSVQTAEQGMQHRMQNLPQHRQDQF